MFRSSTVALFASVSLAALGLTTDAFARGGGHFGGGGRFEGRPEFRAPEEERRPEEMRRPAEDARHPDDADHPARDEAGDHRDDAGRALDERRDLANQGRDFRHPVNSGHWDHNQFWNNQFGGRAFNCNGCRWGWAGGVFWPFAYGDVFSFAWWPNAGTPAFWNYGLNYIMSGLFWPNGAYQWPEGYGAYAYDNSYQYVREAHQDVYSTGPANDSEQPQAQPESSTQVAQTCSGFAPGVDSLPMDRIEQTLKPEKSQRAAFDQLEAASAKAETILNGACPSEPPLTPVSRLDALQKRLGAMVQAVDTVKAPFATFSGALTDEQKRELDAMGGSGDGSTMEMGDVGQCIDQGEQFTDVPAQQIEQAVQPDASQRAALDKLKSVSAQAAERLRSGCPTSVPSTPEARLEAMDKRLHETIVAVNDVRPALVGFYDSLSDDQKARFNTLPPQQTGK